LPPQPWLQQIPQQRRPLQDSKLVRLAVARHSQAARRSQAAGHSQAARH